MKTFFISTIFTLFFSISYSQQKKEIRYLELKNETEASYDMSADSSRVSFSIKKFSGDKNTSEEKIYFGFSHRKATKIKSLPLIKLEEYYSNPQNYSLSDRIYVVVPLKDKTFAIWKCSVLGIK